VTAASPSRPVPEVAAVAPGGGTNEAAARLAVIKRGHEYAQEQFPPDTGTLDRDILAPTNQPLKERFEQVLQDFVDIGGQDYQTLNNGFTWGMQMEAWW